VLADVTGFVAHPAGVGLILLMTMLFFSSLAFSVIDQALAVIFAHRHVERKRHPVISAILPYSFVLVLCVALLGITLTSILLQSLSQESLYLLGRNWSLKGISGVALYAVGFIIEVATLTAFYLAMPVGRTRFHHAMIGAITVTLLWDAIRHVLVWYFASISKVSIVYGSLTTAVVAMFSLEIAATLLLFGAQVISEYERIDSAT
jgi:uncharacterized BrkB/YihY/UPF0761 family membrane protein